MKLKIPTTDVKEIKIIDTTKRYQYKGDGGFVGEGTFQLKIYDDGEGYYTLRHYGYVLVIDKIINKGCYNHPTTPYDSITAADAVSTNAVKIINNERE